MVVFSATEHLGDNAENVKRLVKMIRSISKLLDVLDGHGQPIPSEINKKSTGEIGPDLPFTFESRPWVSRLLTVVEYSTPKFRR